jgi:hypothetical protein
VEPCPRGRQPHRNAWSYFPHDHARSQADRWGEDGLAGVSDDEQRLCLALALWNGHESGFPEQFRGFAFSAIGFHDMFDHGTVAVELHGDATIAGSGRRNAQA